MRFVRFTVAIALMAASQFAGAIGPRFNNYPTTTTLSVSDASPSAGSTIQLIANVSSSALGLYVIPMNEQIGGYVDFYANGASVGRVRISANNTPVAGWRDELDYGCYVATRDPSFCTYRFVFGREARVGVSYQVPAQFDSLAFTAKFTGDANFSAASSSPAVNIQSIPTFGSIRGMGGKCLDAVNAGTANGTQIQMYTCTEAQHNQLWSISSSSPYIKGVPSGRVLDVTGLGTTDGSQLQLWDGLGGSNQAWRFTGTSITGVAGKVLDAVGQSSANGTKIQLYTDNRTANQVWNFDPATGQITGIGGKCLDVEGGSTADGAAVQLWDCTGAVQQRFEIGERGTIRGIGGKCLESANGSTANGNQIRMWTCNGQTHQSWRLIGEIRNTGSNRCLADPGRGAQNGARAYIWQCTGDINQRWDYSSY